MIYYKSIIARKSMYFSREGWKPGGFIAGVCMVYIATNHHQLYPHS